ncbi:NADH-quinone oxidoreductase subunit L [Alistipes sp. ZOR0009]|jgi:NADH-quinone oxidoreductase subunit L|uniref:NADH-quinone oxidoreductase subunit L n=1 Tax=Alistipes sp. ZOR0009 TaxID=1339253 RepID=UPI00064749E1|nr:NADH-quinone oxidoreductase subunit L [Alistipes sp. ZOR0009]
MNLDIATILIPLLPLLSFVIIGLAGKRMGNKMGGVIATTAILASLALALFVAKGYFFDFGKVNGAYAPHIAFDVKWLVFNSALSINFGAILDPISVMMLIVVTAISSMVHIFSVQYMHGEERYKNYYSYLSLFTFSMLGLVLSINIFQMYIFWELVGVSSFLLIGYYFTKQSAIAAAKKAFIVTRFADLGFLIGILVLGFGADSFSIADINSRLTEAGSLQMLGMKSVTFLGLSSLSWGALLVFMGAAGKSAMFPLHIWLPDAMEGPTPVSALIHAATMVVAGVYLVARLFPVYSISAPDVLHFIGYVGVFTAIFAAIIATTQTDIKRVLAFSTLSQIGFMMFSIGVAGWGAEQSEGFTGSMFHLFTHAFFKALLFLGAGVVIHAVHSNDMKDMGGLRKALPITNITFLIACLAIAGVPPFAGFFSKETILSSAYHANTTIFVLGIIASCLTAFYMFRLYFNIFWSKPATDHHNHEKGSGFMTIPLIILAIGSVLAGFIPFGDFVTADGKPIEIVFHASFSILPVSVGLLGIIIAYVLYFKKNDKADNLAKSLGGIYTTVLNKFYIDEVYLFITKKIIFPFMGRPAAWFDRNVVDGTIQDSGIQTEKLSYGIKGVQSGKLQGYTMWFLGGVIVLAALLIFKFL